MHNLKLLQLKYVEVSGNYKNFPELRWLCWHRCHLKRIPSGLLASRFLVAIDMSYGNLEKFEPPTVLSSLKTLNLTQCSSLISIRKFDQLPNLENLILWDCENLTHICETIQGLESLSLLNLSSCYELWKGSLNKKLLFYLPRSLKFLFLMDNKLKDDNDLLVLYNGPLHGLDLSDNQFEFIPSNIDLRFIMLRVLNLEFCENLKSILCLPSTIEELYTYGCISLEKVTFQSSRFTLRTFDCRCCLNLCEVQGLFKLVSIEELDEEELGDMKWIKAYQDHKVNLVVCDHDEGRVRHIQMLYEYGIRSTFLQGIKDQSMLTHEYTSSSDNLSFCVPFHRKKHKICGLNVSCVYKLLKPVHDEWWCLFIKISNITKGVTWLYNPFMYCKPEVDENVTWVSYWPIGNIIDAGDEVNVSITVENGMKVSGCGASLVCIEDDGKEEQEAKRQKKSIEMEEVIGGDLSEFEVSTRVYYLCRHDFFKWSTPEVIKSWVGDGIPYTELQGWRKSLQNSTSDGSCMRVEFVPEIQIHRDTLYKLILLGYFDKERDVSNIENALYGLVGVDSVSFENSFTDKKVVYVWGSVDSMAVLTCVSEFEKAVEILDVNYNIPHGN